MDGRIDVCMHVWTDEWTDNIQSSSQQVVVKNKEQPLHGPPALGHKHAAKIK